MAETERGGCFMCGAGGGNGEWLWIIIIIAIILLICPGIFCRQGDGYYKE